VLLFRGLIFRALFGLVVVVAAAAAGWWFFIREDNELASASREIPKELLTPAAAVVAGSPSGTAAASSTAASAGTASAPAVKPPPGVTRYTIIADRSEAAYFADEKLASLSLPSTARGTTKEIKGEFYLKADGLDGTLPSTFTVDLGNLRSDQGQRDRRVQDALETRKFPSTTFTATKLSDFPKEFTATESAFKMTGVLDLHGVKKEVTWEMKVRKEGNIISGLATVRFRFDEFGITPPNIAGFVAVKDDVALQVQLFATAE
jgi:polyisoprenoid-binding protein YceI